MIDPITLVTLTILTVWNIVLTASKASDTELSVMKFHLRDELMGTIPAEIKSTMGKEFARDAVSDYLKENWYGYYGHADGEGSRLTKEIAKYVTQDVEKEVKVYLSLETTVDDIVTKLNKKQLKG